MLSRMRVTDDEIPLRYYPSRISSILKMRVLVLDDEEIRHTAIRAKLPNSEQVHVYTAEEAIEALDHQERFDIAFLDHDLGTVCTGREVTRLITELPWYHRPTTVIIHSVNPVGAQRMHAELVDMVDEVLVVPFPRLLQLDFRTF